MNRERKSANNNLNSEFYELLILPLNDHQKVIHHADFHALIPEQPGHHDHLCIVIVNHHMIYEISKGILRIELRCMYVEKLALAAMNAIHRLLYYILLNI